MKLIKQIAYFLTLLAIPVFLFFKWNELKPLLDLELSEILLLISLAFVPILINSVYFHFAIKEYRVFLTFKESMGLTVLNTMYAYLLPAKTGVVIRAYYLKAKYAFPYETYISFLAGNYLIGSFVSLLIGDALSIYFWSKGVMDSANFISILVATPLAFLLLYSLDRISIPIEKIKNKMLRFIKNSTSSIRNFKTNKNLLIQTTATQAILLLVSGFRLFITFQILGFDVDLIRVLAVQVVLNFSLFISITPGNLGVREGIIAFSAAFLGMSTDEALLVAVVDRAALMLVIFMSGLLYSRLMLNDLEKIKAR